MHGVVIKEPAKLTYSAHVEEARSQQWPSRRQFYNYRQDAAKLETAGIKFTHRPKYRNRL